MIEDKIPFRAENVKRFEVIDHRKEAEPYGRVMVLKDVEFEVHIQDNGQTFKIFIR